MLCSQYNAIVYVSQASSILARARSLCCYRGFAIEQSSIISSPLKASDDGSTEFLQG
ncbi:uncharacterized protein L969DRAFT_48523 [Mixia osmundae IAM 14324]|uniref:Uncharacterized protein n=1 Tax=Mixia osmundae (strain CBS 9802 / IAM 14324 / JCM 22182 / KY 12970) TaxID=764103 RepID=G7DZP6_MIXOS|nr:uncharacterized protein L969DRAFT_48523 [Mixia osmundae IAM 14324]KEI39284.1 hypothetical protein L969DRAFT_48523 [Mixia osmundae IAM 14324]GAA96056.1 hypothetical protein E5Q_02717 [Mixia osmundae IAM 14324]